MRVCITINCGLQRWDLRYSVEGLIFTHFCKNAIVHNCGVFLRKQKH